MLLFATSTTAQDSKTLLADYTRKLESINQQEESLLKQIEEAKLSILREDIQKIGLPKINPDEEVINHTALSLVYDEKHEQAKWVVHIISPDIFKGSLYRSNDFRVDPKVKTGSAVEEDYFLKYLQADSTYKYDGFGYDRGHLAPSADFRWSAQAMSDSYYYSNMSPQVADFNREKWAELEGALRGYLFRNMDTQLYVCTGGELKEGLPVIERSINKVSIPKRYWKVVVDVKNKKGIAFLMPNSKLSEPLQNYATSIDEIEKLTGLDFFVGLPDEVEKNIEAQNKPKDWLPEDAFGDAEPVSMNTLPARHYNTKVAAKIMGKDTKVTVVGTVVGTRTSRKGNILLNLDKRFPNQVFTVFIKKENIANFSYDPEKELDGKKIMVTGIINNLGGKPAMFLTSEEQISTM